MCGPNTYNTEFKAKKYKLEKHFLSKVYRVSQKKGDLWEMVTEGHWVELE